MAYSRRLGVVSILSACWFVAIGCSDDEDRKDNGGEDGGEGGDGGGKAGTTAGGASSKAGNGGKGGTAGSAGSASAGDAGNGAGGDVGMGGGGGDAGSGGIVAGAGGEGTAGSPTGDGGASGSPSGAGGESGAPAAQLLTCSYECEDSNDCSGQTCDEVTHRCFNPIEVCEVKDDCAPFANFSWTPCNTTADCFNDGTDACINWQGKGVGYCAFLTLDGCVPFVTPGIPTTVAELGGNGGNVSVCVDQGVCLAGTCDFACNSDLAAPCLDSGHGDTCNPTTGRCECAAPAECASNVCGVDSLCQQCVIDDHCPGGQSGRDKCVDGRCGCSSVDVCPTAGLPNATPHCE